VISVGPLRFVPLLLLSLACDRVPLTDFALNATDRGKGLVQRVLLGRLIDCPDGIALCSGGVVKASRLATVGLPCHRAGSTCACPWDEIGICPAGCVSDGLQVAMDRTLAAVQLCAPASSPFASTSGISIAGGAAAAPCEESELYRCIGGIVIDCAARRVVAPCPHGCFAEGAFVREDASVCREAAFAILCSR
jgi:hypothetical protein